METEITVKLASQEALHILGQHTVYKLGLPGEYSLLGTFAVNEEGLLDSVTIRLTPMEPAGEEQRGALSLVK